MAIVHKRAEAFLDGMSAEGPEGPPTKQARTDSGGGEQKARQRHREDLVDRLLQERKADEARIEALQEGHNPERAEAAAARHVDRQESLAVERERRAGGAVVQPAQVQVEEASSAGRAGGGRGGGGGQRAGSRPPGGTGAGARGSGEASTSSPKPGMAKKQKKKRRSRNSET